jgi:type IV pilus assembly protein PilC
MARFKVFPSMLVQMVRVGEETGTLDSNLETMGVFYEEEADRNINTLAAMIQPALMLFIGGIVGFIAMSVVGAMYASFAAFK